jgi:hypothetical protein
MRLRIAPSLFFWLACCAMVAAAADLPAVPVDSPATQPVPDSATPAASAPPAATQPLRDPTQIDPALARALAAGQGGTTVQVTRRGLIAMAGKPTVALIELPGSGIFIVQEGSVLTASANGVRTPLKVEKLSRDGVVITAESKNVTVVIR